MIIKKVFSVIELFLANNFGVITGDNLELIINKPVQGGFEDSTEVFTTKNIADQSVTSVMKQSSIINPLYLYTITNSGKTIDQSTKRFPNLNLEIVYKIAKDLGLNFVPDKEETISVLLITMMD